MSVKRIYFVRHGQTDANLHEYVPSKEEPLNDTGLHQAFAFAERVRGMDFEKLVVSDFVRTQQTAESIVTSKMLTPEVVPCFGEVIEPSSLFGVPDVHESVIAHRTTRNAHVEDPSWRQEDGENFTDVFKRIGEAKRYLETDEAESLLIVSHSFFIQLFTAAILLSPNQPTHDWFKIAKTLKCSNIGITHFTIQDGIWRLILWNDHAHFAE